MQDKDIDSVEAEVFLSSIEDMTFEITELVELVQAIALTGNIATPRAPGKSSLL